MPNKEIIIDGSHFIAHLTGEPVFAPLLQLLTQLHQAGYKFYCYFDADTAYLFDNEKDKQHYQNLIKLGLSAHFIQVTGLDADYQLLQQAQTLNLPIISADHYITYQTAFPFVTDTKRVVRPTVNNGVLQLEALKIEFPITGDTMSHLVYLINELESATGKLTGEIDKYREEREFGFIKRPNSSHKLFFKKEDILDETLDPKIVGQEVVFKIDVEQTAGIFYFCAVQVQRKVLPEDNQSSELSLSEEFALLKESKQYLQQQTGAAVARLEIKVEELKQHNKHLEEENYRLKETAAVYQTSDNEAIRRLQEQIDSLREENDGMGGEIKMLHEVIGQKDRTIEGLTAEINHFKALYEDHRALLQRRRKEVGDLAMTVDVQREKITHLDSDLKSTLRLMEVHDLDDAETFKYEQLQKDYQVLERSVHQKNLRIAFLSQSIADLERQLALNTTEVMGQGAQVDNLVERIQELERTNRELSQKVALLAAEGKTTNGATPDAHFHVTDEQPADMPPPPQRTAEPARKKEKPPKPVIKKIPDELLEDWWNGLSPDWRKAHNQAVLSRGEVLTMPSFGQIQSLFERTKFDIVGGGILLFGLNQLSYKLKDLNGILELKQMTELNLSGNDFAELDGIEQLPHLETLNCTSNRLTSLRGINKLSGLKTLIVRDNNLSSLDGIEAMEDLEYLNVLYNQNLRSIEGVEALPNLQVLAVPGFKTRIIKQIEKLQTTHPNLEVRNV